LRIFVKQINKDLNDIRDTFTIIGHLLHGNTSDRITTALVEMSMYSFHILSQREKFTWIDREPIKPTDVDTIITSLKNIALLADTYTLTGTGIDNLAQSIERRDNPAAYNLSRSSSRSSSSSSTSTSSSGSSSSSSLSSPRYHSQPLPPFPSNHHIPPPLQRQSVRSLNLEDIAHPLSGLDILAAAAANASGKKYRKTKVKRRRNIKATHRRPLVRANSRKHRKQK
jgi:hypothetical protein